MSLVICARSLKRLFRTDREIPMNKTNPKSANDAALLPSGFVDLLSPEANAEARAIKVLMDEFVSFGYERVKPPMAEFEASLMVAGGPGEKLAEDTFRVMDPVSHKMMGIRSDITPQIARLASSRLVDEDRPLRFPYANDVLRTRSSQQRVERQFCQVGCEIIGGDSVQADIEASVVALVGLKRLGLTDLTLDLCVPRLVDLVLEASDLDVEDQVAIREAADRKDVDFITQIDETHGQVFAGLLNATGDARDTIEALLDVPLPPSAAAMVVGLNDVCRGVLRALDELGFDDVSLTIDSLEFKGFDYQSGVSFTLFSRAVRGELGRGGRYNVAGVAQPESAVGFTLYMDTIRSGMAPCEAQDVKHVSADTSWDELMDLKSKGFVVVRDF